MEPLLIISAIIRLASLKYAFSALFFCGSLPSHIYMFTGSISDSFRSLGHYGLVTDAVNIGSNLIIAVFLWLFATRIAFFVLKTLEKIKNG